jgi:hypothetical protein
LRDLDYRYREPLDFAEHASGEEYTLTVRFACGEEKTWDRPDGEQSKTRGSSE